MVLSRKPYFQNFQLMAEVDKSSMGCGVSMLLEQTKVYRIYCRPYLKVAW